MNSANIDAAIESIKAADAKIKFLVATYGHQDEHTQRRVRELNVEIAKAVSEIGSR